MVHLVPHATDQGFTLAEGSVIFIVWGGFIMAGNIASGISDRIGRAPTYLAGALFGAASAVLLGLIEPGAHPARFYAGAAMSGFSLGLLRPTVSSLTADLFEGPGFGKINGAIMTVCVALVIIGGLKRIAQTAEKIVPAMCGIYVAACLVVILMNIGEVPAAFGKIITGAMTPEAGFGGFIGVLVTGFKRAAFSNEAGIGSAAIAHSAAKTQYPVREGIVALLEPFIDTVVVCTMTALVIVVTGAYNNPELAIYVAENNGAGLTSRAFAQEISWFPYVLSFAVVMFAFSTMISWSYYGERCWSWLFGDGTGVIYRILFLVFTFAGSIITANNILDFGDLMILGMALPNILGVLFLTGKVKKALTEYTAKLRAGDFDSTP